MPFVVNTFDNAVVAANPNNLFVGGLALTHDGSYSGLPFPAGGNFFGPDGTGRIESPTYPNEAAPGVVIDYTYNTPIAAITSVRLWDGGGAVLNDGDGFQSADIEIYNSLNVLIFSGTINGANSPAPNILDVGLLQDVARVSMFNIVGWPGGSILNGQPGQWWRELETLTPDADCAAATDITFNSATLNADIEAVPDGNFYQWSWGTLPDPETFDRESPLISTDGSNPNFPGSDPISYPITTLQPNTTYYYRVCIYDGDAFTGTSPQDGEVSNAEQYNSNPICSEVCSFTTPDAASWCGGFFDPNDCILVDIDGTPNNGDEYFNCNQF